MSLLEDKLHMWDLTDAESIAMQEAEAREQRWHEFVNWLKMVPADLHAAQLRTIANLMSGQRDPYYTPQHIIDRYDAFVETEGWDGVLTALARAIREQQEDAAEVERRR